MEEELSPSIFKSYAKDLIDWYKKEGYERLTNDAVGIWNIEKILNIG